DAIVTQGAVPKSEARKYKFQFNRAGDDVARGETFYANDSPTGNDYELVETGQNLGVKTYAYRRRGEGPGTEQYAPIIENRFLSPLQQPLSTFSIDVDTASYANVRRFLTEGRLPPPSSLRIEELVNYFRYDYPQPSGNQPFS